MNFAYLGAKIETACTRGRYLRDHRRVSRRGRLRFSPRTVTFLAEDGWVSRRGRVSFPTRNDGALAENLMCPRRETGRCSRRNGEIILQIVFGQFGADQPPAGFISSPTVAVFPAPTRPLSRWTGLRPTTRPSSLISWSSNQGSGMRRGLISGSTNPVP